MGNQSNAKVLRGQLRQIAKELLPEALSSVLVAEQYKQLQAEIHGKLQVIQAQVTETLTRLDERSKEMQMFVMRQVANGPMPEGPQVTENTLTTPQE